MTTEYASNDNNTCCSADGCCSTPVPSTAVSDFIAQRPDAVVSAGIAAAQALAWYSLPDFVRSRPLRAIIKAGLLVEMARRSGLQLYTVQVEDPWAAPATDPKDPWAAPKPADEAPSQEADLLELSVPEMVEAVRANPAKHAPMLAIGAGVVAASVGLAVAGEKWLFRRGERRRAQGRTLPHLRQAIPLAALTFALDLAASYVDQEA